MTKRLSIVALLSFVAAAWALPGAPHELTLKGNKKINCEIVKEGPKDVTYKDEKGKQQTVPNDQVSKIDYKEDFPGDLGAAENALDRRDFFKAESSAEEACKSCADGRLKDLFLGRARVAKAKALRGQASYKAAADVAKDAIAASAGTKWEVAAHLERVLSLAALGDDSCKDAGSEAEKACEAYPNEVGRDYRAEIALAEGEYFLLKKDSSSAKEKFGTAESSPKFGDRASLGRGRVRILENDFQGAEEIFEKIAKESSDPDALAGAALGLGDSARAKAERANPISGDDLRACLEKYLRGVVLAAPGPGSMGENHEKAIRGAAEVCELIAFKTITVPAKNAKDWAKQAAAQKFFVDYARKLYEEIQKTYPSSQQKDKDQERIKALKAKSAELTPATTEEGQKN